MQTRQTKQGIFSLLHGHEGPRHDPYSYAEYTFEPKDSSAPRIILHGGLAEWIKIGDKKVVAKWDVLVTQFKDHAGMEPHEVERLLSQPVYDSMRGVRLKIELTVNDIRWIIRGLNYAASKSKSRVFRTVLGRVAYAIGKAACDAHGDHIMFQNESSIGPDSGSESFQCNACGWGDSVTYY